MWSTAEVFLINPFSRRLYLRIWLAVVGGVAVLTLAVGWAWRVAASLKRAIPHTSLFSAKRLARGKAICPAGPVTRIL